MSNKNQHAHNFYCTVFVNKQKGMSTLNFIAFTPYKILSSTNTFKKKRVGGVKCKTATKKHTCVCFGRSKQTRASKARPCDTQRIATSNRVLTVPPQFQKKGRWCKMQNSNKKSTLACALVEASGLEPPTPTLSGWCSNLLSYASILYRYRTTLCCIVVL